MPTPVLQVKNLSIDYLTKDGPVHAVKNVSFEICEGESVGLVGESGCGKTTITKALMGLLPENGQITNGQILYKGKDITHLEEKEMRKLRLNEIAMISQSAMNALNPVYTVGDQIIEGIKAHTKMSTKEAKERTLEVFDIIGIDEKRLNAYPHQLSGGMKQRVIIAMALSLNPGLILADEPTTALDVVVQDKILSLIKEIQHETQNAMLFITHDISVVSEVCEKIIVMYNGEIMEMTTTKKFFTNPAHPYSKTLLKASPNLYDCDDNKLSEILANLKKDNFDSYKREDDEFIEIKDEHSIMGYYPEEKNRFMTSKNRVRLFDKLKLAKEG